MLMKLKVYASIEIYVFHKRECMHACLISVVTCANNFKSCSDFKFVKFTNGLT